MYTETCKYIKRVIICLNVYAQYCENENIRGLSKTFDGNKVETKLRIVLLNPKKIILKSL